MPRTKLVVPKRKGKQLATRKAREVQRAEVKVDAAIYDSDDEEAEAYEVSVLIDNF
jgi:hypothetical protein